MEGRQLTSGRDDLPRPRAGSAGVRRLVVLSYILAISIPPVGLILGVALSLRFRSHDSKHGIAVIALSIIASIVWIVVITSGALNTPTTGY